MNLPHFRRKRVLAYLVVAGLLLLTLNYILKSEEANGCGRTSDTGPCLLSLFPKVLDSLTAQGVSSYLCYYALWGALKDQQPLPWTNKVELCLRNEELSDLDEGQLLKSFRRYGVNAYYDSANGLYRATLRDGSSACEVYLYVFEEDKIVHRVRRVGWKNRLLPPDSCDTLHCFPVSLLTPPLKETTILGATVNVPHDGIEVLKYMFPDSWWKGEVPPKCD